MTLPTDLTDTGFFMWFYNMYHLVSATVKFRNTDLQCYMELNLVIFTLIWWLVLAGFQTVWADLSCFLPALSGLAR